MQILISKWYSHKYERNIAALIWFDKYWIDDFFVITIMVTTIDANISMNIMSISSFYGAIHEMHETEEYIRKVY